MKVWWCWFFLYFILLFSLFTWQTYSDAQDNSNGCPVLCQHFCTARRFFNCICDEWGKLLFGQTSKHPKFNRPEQHPTFSVWTYPSLSCRLAMYSRSHLDVWPLISAGISQSLGLPDHNIHEQPINQGPLDLLYPSVRSPFRTHKGESSA